MLQCDFCYEWISEGDAITDAVIDENLGTYSHIFFCSRECLKRFTKEMTEMFERN